MKPEKKKKIRITEYLMHKALTPPEAPSPYRFETGEDKVLILGAFPDMQKETAANWQLLGSFRLLPYTRDHTVYFYDFSIEEALRGQGLGTAVFPHILGYLYTCGYRNILLQVSDANPAAFSLYKNSGLTTGESVVHYEYVP